MRTRLLPIILGLLLLLTAVCPLTAAAVSDPTGTDAPLPECFQQADARWADKELLGSNGCGLLALVNAVNYLTGNFIDPVELAVYAHRIDAYNGSVGGGTARWVLYNQLARYEKQYGFSVTDTGMDAGVRHRDFIRNLQQGGVAVCHVYGHFITIVDYDADADSYLVYDSAANPTKRNTTASPTWLSGEYLSTSAYMTVDWWCLLERTGDSRNTIGDRVRRNQPVELYRRVQPGTALTLTGTASASGGIRSLFYVVDYDYDNTVELPDSVTAEANTEVAFSVSPDLSGLGAGVHTLRLSARGANRSVSDIAVCTLFVGNGTDGSTDASTGDVTVGFSGYIGLPYVMQKSPVALGTRAPCFRAETDAVLPLGEVDLSGFAYAVIAYSVKDTLTYDSGEEPACIGFKTTGTPYSGGSSGYNTEGSLAVAPVESGAEGLKYERQIVLDLSGVDYAGELYLSTCVPEKQYVYIRSLRFCTGRTPGEETGTGTATAAAETTAEIATEPEPPASSSGTDAAGTTRSAGSCASAAPAGAVMAVLLPGAWLTCRRTRARRVAQ